MEYCDTNFVYGFCDGNARAAVQEYQRRFPDRRIPSRSVFTRIHQTVRDTGSLPSVSLQSEREVVRRLTHWVKAHPELLSVISFSDEASFTRDDVNNLRNVDTWSHDNPHETSVTDLQRRFTVNVWYGVLGNKLSGPFVFDNLTGKAYEVFLRNELPGLLEDIPLMIGSQMYLCSSTGIRGQLSHVSAGQVCVMYSAWNPKTTMT